MSDYCVSEMLIYKNILKAALLINILKLTDLLFFNVTVVIILTL